MKSENIIESFLTFFKKNGHFIEKSSPIINRDDPTLMFVNSGMVQFKDFFLGQKVPPYTTATTNQKCIRAGGKHNDLCNVGYTKRHHTFFEMLGNFSFGSYFKEQAIFYAWDFITNILGIDSNRIYITHYHTDIESANLIKKITGLSSSHIFSIKTNDNFWQMADTGPCGPCVEFFYDHKNGIEDSFLSSEHAEERFVEIWNVVFMEYNRDINGTLHNIPKKCVDTGMGLERITAVMQCVDDNFKTDIFSNILNTCSEVFKNDPYSICNKVVADHIRSASFIISEGIVPSNIGRGYILRKILRRAISFCYRGGNTSPIINHIASNFIKDRKGTYTDLYKNIELIKKIIFDEEILFLENLGRGLKMIDKRIENLKSKSIFPSEEIFKLYDTHGLPLEVIEDVLKEKDFSIDTKEVQNLLEQQKDTGRASWNGSLFDKNNKLTFVDNIINKFQNINTINTEFVGYTNLSIESKVIAIIGENQELLDNTYRHKKIFLILNRTCFYGESGGQEGDIGIISTRDCKSQNNSENNSEHFYAKVIKTHKTSINSELNSNNISIIFHECEIEKGIIAISEEVNCYVNEIVRNGIKASHSATHLLHFMLKKYLGEQVNQSGSLVSCNKLRFDFNHNTAISKEILEKIELEINSIISSSINSSTTEMPLKEAVDIGAISIFTEKYSNIVRVVSIGNSKELCGGTHVQNTSEIGSFVIISESSIASGLRRIDAYTGEKAFSYLKNKINTLEDTLNTQKTKIHELQKEIDEKDLQIFLYKFKEAKTTLIERNNISIRLVSLANIPHSKIRNILFTYKSSPTMSNSIYIIISDFLDKRIIVVFIESSLLEKISAKTIFSQLKKKFNISGGGNNEISQSADIGNISIDEIIKFFQTEISLQDSNLS